MVSTRALLISLILSVVASCFAVAFGTAGEPALETFCEPLDVRTLPGGLDKTLMFNSNSPEVVQTEGILLSTFPPAGKQAPNAHLSLALKGRFDLFLHHIAKAPKPDDMRTLYLGLMVSNPGGREVKLKILQAATYLSQPDAPFVPLPPVLDSQEGKVFAGPGDRVTNEVLRGKRQDIFPPAMTIKAGESRMLLNLPVPVRSLTPPINGRSALIRLQSSGPVYAATLAMFALSGADGSERAPTLGEWQKLLNDGPLAGPREKEASPPGAAGEFRYGRVGGVASGARWRARVRDKCECSSKLTIPAEGRGYAYVLDTVDRKTLGTSQMQSAPLVVRYPDTAYSAHGNYGVEYNLTFPLYNPANQRKKVTISVETPVQADKDGLVFYRSPPERPFFRGTIRFRYAEGNKSPQTRYIHLVERRGERIDPPVTLFLGARQRKLVQVDFLYPPDATPPQVITVRTAQSL